ncbi:glycosyltransferase [Candidatus Woesearchaeota archaeon]|nr:glycosyltransferase [Candidatus Woesearchaeota archaeon]
MKIVFICQGSPHDIHKTWLENVTNNFTAYIPNFICKIKPLRDFIYLNSVVNQFFALLKSINTPKADIYVVEGFKTILPAILNKRKGTKIILINSDTFFLNYPKQKGIIKKIYEWYIKKVDYFICTSSIMKEMASKYSKAPCYIVHPFVDTNKFKNKTGNLKSSNICTISTARHSKGADIMLDSFKKFNKKFPKSKLFVCDWGEYARILKKENNVITPGLCDPVPYLNKSGLYLNAARLEPFGVNIIEAMYVGIPPVISKYCGAKDIVEQVDKSLICELDADLIANRLIKLQKNPNKKKKLGEKCKKVALKYNKESSVKRFKEVFSKIIKIDNKKRNF